MHGNLWEWCQDNWHDNYNGAPTGGSAWLSGDENFSRVRRGGSWICKPQLCRSDYRGHRAPDRRVSDDGFRVVCSARAENQSSPIVYVSPDNLASEKNIDYTKLRDLLAANRWQEADEETWKIVLTVTETTERGYLYSSDIDKIPGLDLMTIDQLWVKYSRGKFGFSTQKRIWHEVNQDWQTFIERVGWKESNNSLTDYNALIFSLDAPAGHLPFQYGTPDSCWVGSRCIGYGSEMHSLLSRPEL